MRYLLSFSIGPVQGFIAASRRTGDLKAGSDLLLKITQHVADTLPGDLVFPARTPDGAVPLSTNKILVLLPEETDPVALVREARQSAQNYLLNEWEEVLTWCRRKQLPSIDTERAKAQLKVFLEFFAAWEPCEENYTEARLRVEGRLAGRKALRDFTAWHGVEQNPKSPLDPSWESVISVEKNWTVPEALQRQPLWLKKTETLDGASLYKRVRGRQDTYGIVPSTSKMAVRSHLFDPAYPERKESPAWHRLQELEGQYLTPRAIDLGDFFFRQEARNNPELQEVLEQHPEIPGLVREALAEFGATQLPPYYAILIADGDRMGELLSNKTLAQHQSISSKLNDFAEIARDWILNKHHGYPIFVGGDDVMALLPVPTAIACAADLAELFKKETGATLSAGIAIVHYREPLQRSIQRAREAEKAAKNDAPELRNGLAVHLYTRGGAPARFVGNWSQGDGTEEGSTLKSQWKTWIEAFRKTLTRGVPYELRDLADELLGPRGFDRVEIGETALQAEVERIFKRKRKTRAFADTKMTPAWVKTPEDLRRFAEMLIIARFIAHPEADR